MTAPFVVPDDAYTVLTPYGVLGAYFPDDGPVLWTGSACAKEYFAGLLRAIVPPTGFGYTMETLGEVALQTMLIPDSWGVSVRDPVAVVQAQIEAIRTGAASTAPPVIEPPEDPQNAPQWPQLNRVKLESL